MNNLMFFALIFIIAFASTAIATRYLISKFSKHRVGQTIREEGPSWHMKKTGTPTMGGISFIMASFLVVLISFVLLSSNEIIRIIDLVVFGVLNGFIGLIDDLAKYRKKQNEGLKPLSKLILQVIASVIYVVLLKLTVGITTVIEIPILNFSFDLGILYYPIAIFVLCGFVNAVNLTDGLDGLASSVSLTSGMFLFVAGLLVFNSISLTTIGTLIVGIALGFLIFNLYPAKIFMGDTGSLFLGGIIAGSGVLLNNIFLVLGYGFVFLVEAMSVILQVVFFKITKGKRLFMMAPIHHHFEKKGWGEMKIVSIFTGVNAIICVVTLLSLVRL